MQLHPFRHRVEHLLADADVRFGSGGDPDLRDWDLQVHDDRLYARRIAQVEGDTAPPGVVRARGLGGGHERDDRHALALERFPNETLLLQALLAQLPPLPA